MIIENATLNVCKLKTVVKCKQSSNLTSVNKIIANKYDDVCFTSQSFVLSVGTFATSTR
jgi:hypothetical protein